MKNSFIIIWGSSYAAKALKFFNVRRLAIRYLFHAIDHALIINPLQA